jgi:predicted transport protein
MPLYQLTPQSTVTQVKPASFQSEKELQQLFEANLEKLLGVRFIATEFFTGDRQKGRIDTLGLDQDGSPTIIEYKKSSKENVINQGLFYLDWLVDHKGDFTMAAQEVLGDHVAIDWSQPRLILIAESFSEYDKYAVNRIDANIELWTYRRYGEKHLYLEPIFTSTPLRKIPSEETKIEPGQETFSVEDHLEEKTEQIKTLFTAFQERLFALGDEGEIIEKPNKMYISYKHGKNFCEVKIQSQELKMWLDIVKQDLIDPHDLARDVSEVGHHGTGDVEVKLSSMDDIDKVMTLIEQSYRLTT